MHSWVLKCSCSPQSSSEVTMWHWTNIFARDFFWLFFYFSQTCLVYSKHSQPYIWRNSPGLFCQCSFCTSKHKLNSLNLRRQICNQFHVYGICRVCLYAQAFYVLLYLMFSLNERSLQACFCTNLLHFSLSVYFTVFSTTRII